MQDMIAAGGLEVVLFGAPCHFTACSLSSQPAASDERAGPRWDEHLHTHTWLMEFADLKSSTGVCRSCILSVGSSSSCQNCGHRSHRQLLRRLGADDDSHWGSGAGKRRTGKSKRKEAEEGRGKRNKGEFGNQWVAGARRQSVPVWRQPVAAVRGSQLLKNRKIRQVFVSIHCWVRGSMASCVMISIFIPTFACAKSAMCCGPADVAGSD